VSLFALNNMDAGVRGIHSPRQITYTRVRVWPVAEHFSPPVAHLVRVGEEVFGLTLCNQPARHPMQPTPPTDLVGLADCAECKRVKEES